MAPNKKTKRLHDCVDSDSENEGEAAARKAIPDAWPRFLMVEAVDAERPLSGLSPFAIKKFFTGVASSGFSEIKKIRTGFLVKCDNKKTSEQLLKRNGTVCIDRPIRVSAHRGLNSCKGVIRCKGLRNVCEAEIKQELAEQGVSDVYRVHIRKDGIRERTDTLFLTFVTPKLPPKIKVGLEIVDVSLFIPSPLRCFKCQRFGHSAKICKSATTVCHKCGETEHEGECRNGPKCVNCTEDHPTSSKECPIFKKEAAIQKVRAEKGVSFPEAKRLVEQMNSVHTTRTTYATVVKSATSVACQTVKSSTSVACQTDMTWVDTCRTIETRQKSTSTQASASTGGGTLSSSHRGSHSSSSPSPFARFNFAPPQPPPSLSPSPTSQPPPPTSSKPLPQPPGPPHRPSVRSATPASKGSRKPDNSKGREASYTTPPTSPSKTKEKVKKYQNHQKKGSREQKGDKNVELKNSFSPLEDSMEDSMES